MDPEEPGESDEDFRKIVNDGSLDPELVAKAQAGDMAAKKKLTQIISSRKYRVNKKMHEKEMEIERNNLKTRNLELKKELSELRLKVEEAEAHLKNMTDTINHVTEIIQSLFFRGPLSFLLKKPQ